MPTLLLRFFFCFAHFKHTVNNRVRTDFWLHNTSTIRTMCLEGFEKKRQRLDTRVRVRRPERRDLKANIKTPARLLSWCRSAEAQKNKTYALVLRPKTAKPANVFVICSHRMRCCCFFCISYVSLFLLFRGPSCTISLSHTLSHSGMFRGRFRADRFTPAVGLIAFPSCVNLIQISSPKANVRRREVKEQQQQKHTNSHETCPFFGSPHCALLCRRTHPLAQVMRSGVNWWNWENSPNDQPPFDGLLLAGYSGVLKYCFRISFYLISIIKYQTKVWKLISKLEKQRKP